MSKKNRTIVPKNQSRIPENSVFFEKVVPYLLGGMALLTIVLILLAAGVLLGFVKF